MIVVCFVLRVIIGAKDEEGVSYMFMLFEFMFPIIFVIVFGMIIFQFVTGIGTWHKNNQSPRLSVSATIVAKRENIITS